MYNRFVFNGRNAVGIKQWQPAIQKRPWVFRNGWKERHHTNTTLLLCKGQELNMSPTQGQAIFLGGNSFPAISPYPKARLYGWLPLSDASGIISIAIGHPQYYSLMQYFSVIGHYKCRTRYCRISHSSQRDFVKKYSNFDPKLRASARTKGSLGRKNAIF